MPRSISTAPADGTTRSGDHARRPIYPASFEIIVQARNEADRLPEGLAALCQKAATLPLRTAILVVDSASTDATSHIVRNWPAGPVPVGLLRCRQPGKGIAVRAGLLATRAPVRGILRRRYGHRPGRHGLRAAAARRRDVARSSGRVRWRPRRSRTGAARPARWAPRCSASSPAGSSPASPTPSADSSSSPGRWPGPAALPLRTAGFAFDIELIANCLRLGATLAEIPVCWRDVSGSTFSVRRHSAAAFRDMASIWLRSRIGGGGHVPARPPPPTRQELPSADMGRFAAGATTT